MRVALALVIPTLMFCALSPNAVAQKKTLAPFRMTDQFDRIYSQKYMKDRAFLAAVCDQKGSEYNDEWVNTIIAELKAGEDTKPIQLLRVANLDGVPKLMDKAVRLYFPKDKKIWVLMDWEGHFESTYKLKDEHCNLVLFDAQGKLVSKRAVKKLDTDILDSLVGEIRELQNPKAPESETSEKSTDAAKK